MGSIPPISGLSSGGAPLPTTNVSGGCGAAGSQSAASSQTGSTRAAVGLTPASTSQPAGQTSSVSYSSSSFVQQAAGENPLAALVMALVSYLLTGSDKDKEKDNPFAALVGMALLSSLEQGLGSVAYFESHSSQYSQTLSTSSASAVQASPYGQSSGTATSGPAGGGSIDVCG